MKPGPKPTPTALKNLHGRSHHKQNKNEPKPLALSVVPTAPSFLGQTAKKLWKEMVWNLCLLSVITEIDLDALARYCVVWERWLNAETMLKKQGNVIKTSNGYPIQNPYLAIANTCLKQLEALGSEFGLTPAARSRVSIHLSNTLENEQSVQRLVELFGPRRNSLDKR
ncbi:MAG: phage terminase small subunit P27 family [Anaerolineaceae bacterium]|jgi:P27 family predicted phage terminase small subunit